MSGKFKIILCTCLVLVLIQFFLDTAHAQTNPAISKMYGDVILTNNYVDRGITQSNKNPALGAELGYWWGGLGRIAFGSASVNYPGESANIEMRVFGEYKFVFTPNSDLKIRDDLVRYFSEDKRNKTIVSLDQNFFGYHFLFMREDNFEGTKTPRNWFGFHRDWALGTSFQLNLTAGYSMVQDYDAYMDALVGISYFISNVTVSLAHSYVSNASQFAGMADPSLIFSIEAKF